MCLNCVCFVYYIFQIGYVCNKTYTKCNQGFLFFSALMNNYVKRVICGRKSNTVVREIVTCNG